MLNVRIFMLSSTYTIRFPASNKRIVPLGVEYLSPLTEVVDSSED